RASAQSRPEPGRAPRHIPGQVFSKEEAVATGNVRLNDVVGNLQGKPPWTRREDRRLQARLDRRGLSRRSQGAQSNTTNNPPLYYALGVIPYDAASSGNLLDRLYTMRLLSAVLAAATALSSFLFLVELLPGTPWAWPV